MEWSAVMKRKRKNPHAVALGRLGGLVRSEAKRRANRINGRKGGLVKSRKKRIAARLKCTPSAPRPQTIIEVIALIRARYGASMIGLGHQGLRFAGVQHAHTA
jgi:hypothetical protein